MQARVRVAWVSGLAAVAAVAIVLGFRSQQEPAPGSSVAMPPDTVALPPPEPSVALPVDTPPVVPAAPDAPPTLTPSSTDARALLAQARAHLDAGEPAAATPLVQRVLALQPTHSGAWNVLGRTELLRLHPHEAEAAFRRACELDSTNAYAHNNLGWLFLQQSRWTAALPWLQTAVRLQSGVAYFHNNLGVAYERLGLWEDASAAYAKAVELEPDRVNARLSLARVSAHLSPALAAASAPADSLVPGRANPSNR